MLDTMTMTKIVGGFCGALLVFLLGNWVAESLYATGGGHGGEGEQAYVIEVAESDTGGAAEEGPDFETVMASADADSGDDRAEATEFCPKGFARRARERR